MKPIYRVNHLAAPLDSFSKFERWHKLACESDPMSARQRWNELKGLPDDLQGQPEKEVKPEKKTKKTAKK